MRIGRKAATRCEWIELLARDVDADAAKSIPARLLPFVESDALRRIIGKDSVSPLTSANVRAITSGADT